MRIVGNSSCRHLRIARCEWLLMGARNGWLKLGTRDYSYLEKTLRDMEARFHLMTPREKQIARKYMEELAAQIEDIKNAPKSPAHIGDVRLHVGTDFNPDTLYTSGSTDTFFWFPDSKVFLYSIGDMTHRDVLAYSDASQWPPELAETFIEWKARRNLLGSTKQYQVSFARAFVRGDDDARTVRAILGRTDKQSKAVAVWGAMPSEQDIKDILSQLAYPITDFYANRV